MPALSRSRAVLRMAGINLLILIGLFLLFEMASRWLVPASNDVGWSFQIDPVTGHAHVPEDFLVSANARTSLSRSRHFTLERLAVPGTNAPLRILTLGGSTTDPLGDRFSGLGGTWPTQLGQLALAHGLATEIANAGVGGFSSAQELLKLLVVTAFHEVDLVIALNGINEIYFQQNRLLAEHDDNLFASDIFLQNVHRGDKSLIRYEGRTYMPCGWLVCFDSHGIRQLGTALDDLWGRLRRSGAEDPAAPRPLDALTEARLARAASIWQQNVRTMHAVAEARGTAFVVALQPTMGIGLSRGEVVAMVEAQAEDHLAPLAEALLRRTYLERINRLYVHLGEACETLAFCIDLSRPDTLPPLSARHYTDPRHPNAAGNRIIAERLLEHLAPLLVRMP